jgi:hypothetical protein
MKGIRISSLVFHNGFWSVVPSKLSWTSVRIVAIFASFSHIDSFTGRNARIRIGVLVFAILICGQNAATVKASFFEPAKLLDRSEPTPIEPWFMSEWQRSMEPLNGPPRHFRYTIERFPRFTDQKFAEAAPKIGDKPDHPDRFEYNAEVARRASGSDLSTYDVWVASNATWRISTRNENNGITDDVALGDGYWWSLQQDVLAYGHAKEGDITPDPTRQSDPRRGHGETRSRINQILLGGIPGASPLNIRPVKFEQSGDNATIRLEGDREFVSKITCRWHQEAARWCVIEIQILASPFAREDTTNLYKLTWSMNDTGEWSTNMIESVFRDGRLADRLRVIEVREVELSEVMARVRLPENRKKDPIRGDINLMGIASPDEPPGRTRILRLPDDPRNIVKTSVSIEPEKESENPTSSAARLPRPGSNADVFSSWIWIFPASFIVIVVSLFFWKKGRR